MPKTKRFYPLLTPGQSEWKNCLRIFLLAALIATVLFLPFVLYDKGIFLLYGDYNVQQIPFYQHGHDMVRQGNFGLDILTDLGTGFLPSYSYYLLGSPFFWLTIPFPSDWVPYLMAPLFILKFASAAATSYVFIRRFTKTPHAAMIGALLYSFSGYMIYSIFYNSFLDVVAFFPLLLIGLEELVQDRKRGRFALAVALNLLLNYYFFVAETVFLLLYFALRLSTKSFSITPSKFFLLLLETVLGVLMGMVLLLPSAIMILQNPRVSHMLFGYDMLFYGPVQRYGLLLQSLFFPPDMPAFPNFFPNARSNWYSVAAYLPLFGMAGVLTFLRERKKNWLRALLILLGIMMFIPLLNSLFNGLNSNFYTRWFFMLTLIMSLATALCLERRDMNLAFGVKTSLVILLTFSLIGILPIQKDGTVRFFSMPNYPVMFWISCLFAIGGIILVYLFSHKKRTQIFYQTVAMTLCGFILLYGISEITFGKIVCESSYYHDIVDRGLNAEFSLEKDEFYRVDVDQQKATDNWPMFWKMPSIQAFHSTVGPGIFSFYQGLGISRDVASRIEEKYYGLRFLLSVKYLFVQKNEDHAVSDPDLPPGFTLYSHENGFDLYENQHFVPMGFWYSHSIDQKTWENCPKASRDRLLLKGLYLDEAPVTDLPILSEEKASQLSDQDLLQDADALAANSCDQFEIDSQGFFAHANLPSDNVVFFSVPYDEGFHATINGKETSVLKAANGLIAIPCQKGENDIRVSYRTPGLSAGILLSSIGIALFLCYRLIDFCLIRKHPKRFGKDLTAQTEEKETLYTEPTATQMEEFYRRKGDPS